MVKEWKAKTIYVDIDTGECISKKLANREYDKLKSTKKTNIKKDGYGIEHGEIEWQTECRKKRQLRLF